MRDVGGAREVVPLEAVPREAVPREAVLRESFLEGWELAWRATVDATGRKTIM